MKLTGAWKNKRIKTEEGEKGNQWEGRGAGEEGGNVMEILYMYGNHNETLYCV